MRHRIVQTMRDMVADQRFFGPRHGLFDRMKLLRDVDARPSAFDHRDNGAQMAFGALQALGGFRVGFVFAHTHILSWG